MDLTTLYKVVYVPDVAFHVLGPLEVLVNGSPVPITSTRQRIVAASLIMAANHVVSVDRLIEAVWDGGPPPSARSQIQICISALRRVLGIPGLIETWPSGYRIKASDEQLDHSAFDIAVTRGRTARAQGRLDAALEHFDAALGLWRGLPLLGMPGRLIAMHASMLEERRLMAIEDRIEVRLALGAHRELAQELVALTAEYPLCERLWGFRMIALYRCGRQAEAMDAYRAARTILVDELGIEPGDQLRQIEHAILNQDSSLDVSVPARPTRDLGPARLPRQLPGDLPDFVPREGTVEAVEAVLTGDANRGAAPVLVPVALITGQAGCGKTATAVHIAHRVISHFPEGQLFVDLRGSADSPLPTSEVLALFLRALGVDADEVPPRTEERVTLFRSCIAGRQVLVILDDVADEQQIKDLIPGVPGSAVLMTSRSRLAGLPGMHAVELGIMTQQESADMLERIVGPGRIAAADDTAGLARLCGGLPLALRICAMRLFAHPHWTVATLIERLASEERRLDELSHGALGVRPVLASAYSALKPGLRELLERLCLLDVPDFSALTTAALLESDLETGERGLDELVAARLIETHAVTGQPIRYGIHPLTRIFVREQIGHHARGQEIPATGRVLGCLLAVSEEAYRRVHRKDCSMLRGTSPRWPVTVQELDRLLADPMAWLDTEYPSLRAAVGQAARLRLDEYCWELAVVTAGLCEHRGPSDESPALLGTALRAVKAAHNLRGLTAVLAALGALGNREFADDDERMLLDAHALFVETGDELAQAFAVRTLALLDRLAGRPVHAVRRYERALEHYRVIGDICAQAHITSGLARAYLEWGNTDRAEALAKESLLLSQRVVNRRLQADALHCLGEVLSRSLHTLAAKAVFTESFQISAREGAGPAAT